MSYFDQFLQQKSASNPNGLFSKPTAGAQPTGTISGAASQNMTQAASSVPTGQAATLAQQGTPTAAAAAGPMGALASQVSKPQQGPGADWANKFKKTSGIVHGIGGVSGAMGAIGHAIPMLSDKQSKEKITQLENELQKTYAALGGAQSPKPDVKAPDTAALDRAAGYSGFDPGAGIYRGVGSYGYEYKDPNAQGAAPGKQSGPMADELKGLPGVVKPGADGMDRVDTGRLSLNNASAIGQHQRDIDDLKAKLAAIDPETGMDLEAEYPDVGSP